MLPRKVCAAMNLGSALPVFRCDNQCNTQRTKARGSGPYSSNRPRAEVDLVLPSQRAEERGRDNPHQGDDRATRREPAGSLLREWQGASRRMNGAAGFEFAPVGALLMR